MDSDLQFQSTLATTTEVAENVEGHSTIHMQSTSSCSSSECGSLGVGFGDGVIVKKEDGGAAVDRAVWAGNKVTGVMSHRHCVQTSPLGRLVDQEGVKEGGSVLRRNRNRRCKNNKNQEESSQCRRSLRRARDNSVTDLHVRFKDVADDYASKVERAPHRRKKSRPTKKIGPPMKEEAKTKSKKGEGGGRSGRKGGRATTTRHKVDIGKEVWKQWKRIGSERRLDTDTDIAAFLVTQLYTSDVKVCTACRSPLQLLCPHCPPPLPSAIPTLLPLESGPPSSPSLRPSPLPSPLPSPVVEKEDDDMELAATVGEEPVPEEPPVQKHRRGRKRKTERQSHMCCSCGATFERAAALKVHMRKHTGEKPFKCRDCDRAFTTSGQLVNHHRKHSGERPYVCTVCNATFPIASSLKQHSRIHTGDRPYACHVCDQRFCYRGDLTAHVRKHTGDRPFLCSDCGKSFAMSSHLSKHKRTHSGYRPFECNVCHKTFPFLNRLTLHMRTHTGEKPFLCADCGSSFIRASTLTIHRRIHHTFEKPCICPYCGHAFADSANLSKHKKNKHGFPKMAPEPPAAGSSGTQLAEPPPSGADAAVLGSGIEVAEMHSSGGVNPGQVESRIPLLLEQQSSGTPSTPATDLNPAPDLTPVQMDADTTVTRLNVLESGDKMFSSVFTFTASGSVGMGVSGVVSGGMGVSEGGSVDEGVMVTKSEPHELKPVGPWKTFPFPV